MMKKRGWIFILIIALSGGLIFGGYRIYFGEKPITIENFSLSQDEQKAFKRFKNGEVEQLNKIEKYEERIKNKISSVSITPKNDLIIELPEESIRINLKSIVPNSFNNPLSELNDIEKETLRQIKKNNERIFQKPSVEFPLDYKTTREIISSNINFDHKHSSLFSFYKYLLGLKSQWKDIKASKNNEENLFTPMAKCHYRTKSLQLLRLSSLGPFIHFVNFATKDGLKAIRYRQLNNRIAYSLISGIDPPVIEERIKSNFTQLPGLSQSIKTEILNNLKQLRIFSQGTVSREINANRARFELLDAYMKQIERKSVRAFKACSQVNISVGKNSFGYEPLFQELRSIYATNFSVSPPVEKKGYKRELRAKINDILDQWLTSSLKKLRKTKNKKQRRLLLGTIAYVKYDLLSRYSSK